MLAAADISLNNIIYIVFFEAKRLSFEIRLVPLSAQMPFACASKATQNGITAAIGASLKTSVLRRKKNGRHPETEKHQHLDVFVEYILIIH